MEFGRTFDHQSSPSTLAWGPSRVWRCLYIPLVCGGPGENHQAHHTHENTGYKTCSTYSYLWLSLSVQLTVWVWTPQESPQMPAPMPGKNTHIVCAIGLFQPLQTHTWEHNITILSKEQHIISALDDLVDIFIASNSNGKWIFRNKMFPTDYDYQSLYF